MTQTQPIEITFGSIGEVKQLSKDVELPKAMQSNFLQMTQNSISKPSKPEKTQTSKVETPKNTSSNNETNKSKKKNKKRSKKNVNPNQPDLQKENSVQPESKTETSKREEKSKQEVKIEETPETFEKSKNSEANEKDNTTPTTQPESQIETPNQQESKKVWSDLFSRQSAPQTQPAPQNKKEKKKKKKKQKAKSDVQPKTAKITFREGKERLVKSIIQYNENDVVLIQPRGLNNVNNSCFMNASLQGLLYIPPFYNLFKKVATMRLDEEIYPLTNIIARFVCEFSPCTGDRLQIGEPFTPSYLLDYMRKLNKKELYHGGQHDAHEFINFVLQTLHEEWTKTEDIKQEAFNLDEESEEEEWQQVIGRNKAIVQEIKHDETSISKIFGGKMRSHIKKRTLKGSLTVQPFFSLHLPIDDNTHHIKDSFKIMTNKEILDKSNTQQITLEEIPKVLILQLKRFTFDKDGPKKINNKIQFFSQLYLDDYIIPTSKLPENDRRRNYELYSVICHHGKDPSSGHYTTFIKHPTGKWVMFDDHKVEIVPQNYVMKQSAYVLIYYQDKKSNYKNNNEYKKTGKRRQK